MKLGWVLWLVVSMTAVAYAETEYGDLGKDNPELQAQYQAKADAEAQAQAQAGLQGTIEAANAGHYRVTVVAPDGTATIYGNNLPPQDAYAVEAQAQAESIAYLERHLVDYRQSVEQHQEWGRQAVMSGREAIKSAPADLDRNKLAQAQADSEKAMTESNASIDKAATEHEAAVKTELQKQKERLRVLISLEKSTVN